MQNVRNNKAEVGFSELANAFDIFPEPVLLTGSDLCGVFCNQAFTRLTGFSQEDLIRSISLQWVGPETDPATIHQIKEALDRKTPFAGTILSYKKNGDTFWNDIFIAPICDTSGDVTNYVYVFRDITEKKSNEEKQEKLQRLYTFLCEHVEAGMILHKADTTILYANATATKLLGVSADNVLGAVNTDPRWRFILENEEPMPISEYPVNRAVRNKAVVKNLLFGIRRVSDLQLKWLLANAFPSMDQQGEVIDVLVTFTDVTDLKNAEAALRKSEERLNLVLRGANDGGWDWDLLTDSIYYAPRWWEILGYQPDALPADTTLWQQLVHDGDRQRVVDFLSEVISSTSNFYEVEFRLRHANGSFIPVLSRGFISRDSNGCALRISGTNTDLTERKAAEERIYELAFYDPLTNLPNRRMLTELLGKAIQNCERSHKVGALLFIDLDNFKILNDTLGHDVGDQLLKQVAQRLLDSIRNCDNVARLGGDEFLVILENLSDNSEMAAANARKRGEAIRAVLNTSYNIDQVDYHSSASIGIALFDDSARSAETILKHADLAMYKAKVDGRDNIRFFDQAMQVAVDQRMRLEADLRVDIPSERIMLYYQPQVNSVGEIVSAEVLARWSHHSNGFIPPSTFIPLAEASGLIQKLGERILHSACEQLAAWQHDQRFARLRVSVNVSVRQFSQPEFVDKVLNIVAQTGANPAKLRLEVTESLFAGDIEDIIAKMRTLRQHGITFSLDDFGTGYSSLLYLQKMPLDELKIDRSFINELSSSDNAAQIVKIIISLANTMNLEIIAEGVENSIQRDFLTAHHCHFFQGFLFSRPEPVTTFEALVLQGSLMPGNAN